MLNNIVQWHQLRVLDLFAGTGAFSIECFSRGAEIITAVEMQPLHVRFIQDNFKAFEMKQAQVIRSDVFAFLSRPSSAYDLIFADPPYDLKELNELPDAVLNSGLLADGGVFVLEHGNRNHFDQHPAFVKEKVYSNVVFSFFSHSN